MKRIRRSKLYEHVPEPNYTYVPQLSRSHWIRDLALFFSVLANVFLAYVAIVTTEHNVRPIISQSHVSYSNDSLYVTLSNQGRTPTNVSFLVKLVLLDSSGAAMRLSPQAPKQEVVIHPDEKIKFPWDGMNEFIIDSARYEIVFGIRWSYEPALLWAKPFVPDYGGLALYLFHSPTHWIYLQHPIIEKYRHHFDDLEL